MKKIIMTVLLCVVINLLNAQITTNEQPYNWKNSDGLIPGKGDVIVLPVPDKVRIENEDKINDQEPGPLRYAYPVHVNFTAENSGSWQTLNDGGKLWTLNVKLPGALSANAMYDKFWLPDGAKFFVYSNETKQFIGAVTSEFLQGNSKEPAVFSTAIIYGENVTFEYYQPASVKESAVISISRIDYGYRYVNNPYEATGLGDSGACQVNINCPEGDNWQAEKHAVARVLVVGPDGSGWCSCALINNTEEDYTPYILTADHCLAGLDAVNNNNAGQWVFYWEYERPECDNAGNPFIITTTGATVIANYSDSDFALLLLTQDPKNLTGVTPYYLGWDRTGNSGTGGVGIHHPSGDFKKISLYTMSPQSTAYCSNTVSSDGNHWRLVWSLGTTEIASSGSPLINNSRHVIGQLHGGYSSCNNITQPDWYGKFSVSWNNNTNPKRRLKDWLDPNNTGLTILDGLCSTVNFTNQTVTTDNIVTNCGDIYVQNVTVTNGAKLTLDAAGETLVESNFEVQSGSELEIK
jgi:hypothetical protein